MGTEPGTSQSPLDSVGAHGWRVPNGTKQLSSAPASFQLSTLLIDDEFLVESYNLISYFLQIIKKGKVDCVSAGLNWSDVETASSTCWR